MATVLVFSDFTCPFAYVTEAALRRIGSEIPLAVEHRALELYPAPAPLPPEVPAERMEAARPLAEEVGLALRPPPFPSRTRKAHEVARFAAERGVGDAMREAVFRAVFEEGRDVGRIDVLVSLAAALGLDPTETRVVLDIDRHADEVLRDGEAARRAGILATPTLVIGPGAGARVMTGAFPLAELREALRQP